MIEIENDTCNYHIYWIPINSSNRNVSCLADSFCEREIPFNRRSFARDSLVAHLILKTYGMTLCCFSHGSIVSFCLCTEISLINIANFAFISQIHLAIVDFSSCNLDSANQAKILIHGTMKLVSKRGFCSLPRPGSILATPSLSFLSAWCITLGMTRI